MRAPIVAIAAIFLLVSMAAPASALHASKVAFTDEVARTCGAQAQFDGEVDNGQGAPQDFAFSAVDPSGWFTFYMTPSARAPAGGKASFVFLATPSPATPAGEYSFHITAEGSSGETATATVWIVVRDCTKLSVLVSGAPAACAGTEFPVSVSVQNNGADTAFGTVSLDLDYAVAGSASFAVAKGETRQFSASAAIPAGTPPGTLTITAYASTPRGKSSGYTAIEVRDCSQAGSQSGADGAGGQASGMSGFFVAGGDWTDAGLVILLLVAAFLFLRGRAGTFQEEEEPEGIIVPEKPLPPFKMPELNLPETLRAWDLAAVYASMRASFATRHRKIQKKIRRAKKQARKVAG